MAGYAPALQARRLDDPALSPVREAIGANRATQLLTAGAAPALMNLSEWRDHLMVRLRRQYADSADATLSELIGELSAYPAAPRGRAAPRKWRRSPFCYG